MLKTLLFLFFFATIYSITSAQNTGDSIIVKGGLFLQHGKILSNKQLISITESNSEAYKEIRKAKTNNGVGNVFGFAGGLLIGYPLGTAIGGGKPNWAIAGAGAGLAAISIPFAIAYKKHLKNLVVIYNNGLKNVSTRTIEYKLYYAGNGVGLNINF